MSTAVASPDRPGDRTSPSRSLLSRRGVPSLLTLIAGLAVGSAFEPTNLWPLILPGVAALFLIVRRLPSRRAFGLGYVFGLGMLGVSLAWLRVLVPGAGPFIAALLVLFESLFFGLLGVALRVVGRLPLWPLWSALCWTGTEWLYSRIPFGGFGWSRLVFAAVDSPLAGWLPLIGAPGVTFLCALAAGLLAWLVDRWFDLPRRTASRGVGKGVLRPAAPVVAALLALGIGGQLARGFQVEPLDGSGSVNVGMVQGNVDGEGIGGMGRARSVTNNHLSETVTLMARAELGAVPMPDFIVWPENSTDIDPLRDARTNRVVESASSLVGRPIFVGAVLEGPGVDERQTAGLWWTTDGVTGRYAKRNLVPFGEYVPLRSTLLPVVPLLELVGSQSVPGTSPGVLDVTLADGRQLSVGDVICFELAYDDTVREAVDGSQVLVVQSNNATYRGTPQIDQQFAITRVRAMESRREITVATTNSVSGFIDRDGRVVDRTREMTSASNSYPMPLRTELTPAMRIAGPLDNALSGAAVVAVLAGIIVGRRTRRTTRPDSTHPVSTHQA